MRVIVIIILLPSGIRALGQASPSQGASAGDVSRVVNVRFPCFWGTDDFSPCCHHDLPRGRPPSCCAGLLRVLTRLSFVSQSPETASVWS